MAVSITIQLDDETAKILQQLATAQHRTESEIVRAALAAYAGTGKRVLPKGIGKYRSGQTDVSARARQILREAVQEAQWP
jgi:hypothetical protein